MDNLLSFYNTILSIEVAIFGIISAVILVFIQLVYTNFTYKHIGHILKNRWIILFFIFSVLDLILTTAGSYFLTIGNANIFNNIFINPAYLLSCLLLIFISISFFTTLIIKNISYLQPHRAIFLLSKSLHYNDIRNYLWKKYPLAIPFSSMALIVEYDLDDESEKPEEDESIGFRSREENEDQKFNRIKKEIAAIKRKVTKSEDPLLPIRDMMIQFIRRSDLSSLTEAQELLLTVSVDFLEKVPKNVKDNWSPQSTLLSSFTRYLIELMETLLEISEKEGLESGKRLILNIAFGYAENCFETESYRELDQIHEFLQRVADSSIGKSSIIFQNILEHFQKIGEKTFALLKKEHREIEEDDRQDILDDLFRRIGWLGERLLMRQPIESSPLMINFGYSTQYDSLFNCLLAFDRLYTSEQPQGYPLIYFDALIVVLKQLVKIQKNGKIKQLDENLFAIVFAFESFAIQAIKVGNSRGAALATLQIKESFQEMRQCGLNDLEHDTIKCLVKIGMMAAGTKEKLTRVDFMSQPLDLWVIDTLIESGANIDNEVMDAYIHSIEAKNHDAVWSFITTLGMKLGSNFGLMFDPLTGKHYSEDDPRRR